MTLVEAVDEVQAAGAARSRTGREFPGQHGVGTGGEAARLLVPDVHPADAAAPDRLRHVVERVAGDAVAAADPRLLEGLDHDICYGSGHGGSWS